jgi:hypothetical protein
VQLTENIDYPETGAPADGDETVIVYANVDGQGWY